MRMAMTAEQHFERALELEALAAKELRAGAPNFAKFYGSQMIEHLKRAAAQEKELLK